MSKLAAVPLLALALACSDGSVVQPDDAASLQASKSAGPVVQMVTGSGHFVPTIGVNTGLWRTFSMTARKYADGSVSGVYNRVAHLEDGGVTKNHGTVTCFTISGNKAWIGGMDPNADPPDIAWQVVDNGEGSGADAPDQNGLQFGAEAFGLPAGFADAFCEEQPEVLYFPALGQDVPLFLLLHDIEGNIQLKP